MATKCPQTDYWGVSEYETMKTSYKWVINNFSESREETGQKIISSSFGSEKDMKTKWHLEVYPKGRNEQHKDYVSIYVYAESNKDEVLAEYSLAIVDSSQNLFKRMTNQDKFQWQTNKECWAMKRSNLENPEKQLLPNDVLTIYCEITYSGWKTTSGQNALKRSYSKLLDDMTALYQNPDDCDVEIEVKGHKFTAHKVILKARSSVFAAMFTHQMEENQQNKVVINDIEKEVFCKLLRFIYTDSVVNEDINSSLQLLSAADKYDLDDLKSICEEYIGSQLTVESVSDVLNVADKHSAQELKVKTINFIKKNSIQVMKTKGWTKLVTDRSDLLDLI